MATFTGLIALLLLVHSVHVTISYKILLLPPPVHRGSTDHLDMMVKLGETLAERRNQVTIILQGETSFTSTTMKVEKIQTHNSSSYYDLDLLLAKVQTESMASIVNTEDRQRVGDMIMGECERMLGNRRLRDSLTKQDFHIAVTDQVHTCGYLYAALLGIPYAVLDTSPYLAMMSEAGAPHPLAYVPSYRSGYSDRMSFLNRVSNYWQYRSTAYVLGTLMNQPFVDLQQRFKIGTERSLLQLRQLAEVYLINTDFALEFPRPLMPNTCLIGGMLTKPATKLPEEIEAFMNESGRAGVIVVSFGKEIDLQFLPKLFEALLSGFKKLSQRVLWESSYRAGQLPINVKIVPKLPLNDVLAHSSTKVLVTAGDTTTVFEALYHAVPMLVIPIGTDSYDNAVRLGAKGMGIVGEIMYFTPERLATSVKQLVEEGSFKTAATRASSILKDQLVHPASRAAFWVEHAIRQGGGEHLRSTAMYFTENQLVMVDVTIFLTILFILLAIAAFFVGRFLYFKARPYYDAYKQRKLDNKRV